MKTKQNFIEFYINSGRVTLTKKDDLYNFLKKHFVPNLDEKTLKFDLQVMFIDNLDENTLEIYSKELDTFGLIQKDVAEFLMCPPKTISKHLTAKGEVPFRQGRRYFLIYDPFDILAFANSKEYEEILKKEEEKKLKKEERIKKKIKKSEEFQNKILTALPDSLIDLYPKARSVKRHFILHIGPTNSGKTYEALQRFREVNRGIYLAPLRLLASEVYSETNKYGVPCSLITGEEAIIAHNATHQSSTIEMLSIHEEFDVAVIDEAQLLSDKSRGGAWTRAILGVCAKEIHVCASSDALYVLKELITRCKDTYQLVEHERKTKLTLDKESFHFPKDVKDNDAFIVFSRRAVLCCAAELESHGVKASVIYGSLPYSVRENEMKRFLNSETKVVVSTDAIGMGLNLPIKRIVFLETEKFDGECVRPLEIQEVKQIAGRAGRFGVFDEGFVNAEYHRKHIRKCLNSSVNEFNKVYLNFPETLITLRSKLSEIIKHWNAMNVDKFFVHCEMDLELCIFLETLTKNKEFIYQMLTIPFDKKNSILMDLWKHLACLELSECDDEVLKKLFPTTYDGELNSLELDYKIYDLLYSFMFKFRHTKYLQDTIKNRNKISEEIIKILKERPLPKKKCSSCGKKLPWNYPYGMCQKCYHENRYFYY